MIVQPYHFKLQATPLHYEFSNQMFDDLLRRARECSSAQSQAKATIRSVEEFERYREQVYAHLLDAIGGLPTEKTPLNARTTGVIEEAEFNIEKVLFESQPEYFVTANCYLPKQCEKHAPAVLFLCGHSDTGKALPGYQKVCRDLVANGFMVLAIDPIGQGERLQYVRDGVNTQYSNTVEHSYAALPFTLQGASVARHFVWDAIRGIDYLIERGDVDENRIGAVGNSGGGTQTALLTLLEPRLAASMPCTWITSQEHMMKSGHVQDGEQVVYGAMERGPNHDDYLIGIAPRPVLIGAAAYDTFPVEGSLQSFERARKIYELYGEPEKLQIVVDPAPHSFSTGLRQACVNWFKQHLKDEASNFVTGDPSTLDPAVLNVTESGQVVTDFPNCRTIYDLNCQRLDAMQKPEARTPQARTPQQLRDELSRVLGVATAGDRKAPIYPRLWPDSHDNFALQNIWFFSALDVSVGGVLFFPTSTVSPVESTAILLLKNGTTGLPENMATVEELLQQNKAVFVFDPRGVGSVAVRSVSASEALHPGSETFATTYPFFTTECKFACDAMMLGQSTLGLRVFDVLRAFDYLRERNDTGRIEIYGVGKAAIWSYFASVLEERFSAVTCVDMLASYRNLCRTRFYDATRFNLEIMAWGLLRCGDLQEFLPCIAPRPLQLIRPRDGEDNVLENLVWNRASSS